MGLVKPMRRLYMILGALAAWAVIHFGLGIFGSPGGPGNYAVQGTFGDLEPPELTLVTPGIQPRSPLRLAPRPGTSRRFTVTHWSDGSRSAEGRSLSSSAVELRLEVKGKVGRLAADGSFPWSWKVARAELVKSEAEGPSVERGWGPELAKLGGLRGRSRLDERGFVLESRLRGGGKRASPSVRQEVAAFLGEPLAMLPEEPIGERAIWEVRRRVSRGGVELEQVDRYELMQRDVHRVELKLRSRSHARPQPVDLPGAQLLSTDLKELVGRGGGSWTLSLTGALDWVGEGWTEQELRLEQSFQGLPLSVESTERSDVVIAGSP